MKLNLTDSDEILSVLYSEHVLISSKYVMAFSLIVTKPFVEKCRSVCAWQSYGRFIDTKINLIHSFNLHIFWRIYKVYVSDQFL